MSLKTLIFMGRSGCGKGTQAKLVVDSLLAGGTKREDILEVTTGDLFRAFIKGTGHTQDMVRASLLSGERQPEFLSIGMWGSLLIDKYRPNQHLIIDGTPRLVAEAEILIEALHFYKRTPIDVVNLEVSEAWATDRLVARGRPDDSTKEAIKKRQDFYNNDVAPAIEYLRRQPDLRFSSVNGERTIEEINKDILKIIF